MSTERDTIIFIGLNETAADEVKALRAAGNQLIVIGKNSPRDKIKIGTQAYDLYRHNELVNFVKQLRVNPAQETQLVAAIESGGANIRDELAELAVVWAEIEKKGSGATRFIISGHSAGGDVWGDTDNILEIELIKKIAVAMPSAAGLIEDLHIAACYAGQEKNLIKWRNIFPNVETIWAYSDSAPGSNLGAINHLIPWAKATRGSKYELDRSIVAKTRKGQNVAVWTKRHGYQAQKSSKIQDLLRRIILAEPTYQAYFTGSLDVADPYSGELRDYYNDLHALLGHPNATGEEIRHYTPRKDTTLRILYFSSKIKMRFAREHAALITRGYKAIGEPAPNFAQLSRKDCIKKADDYERKMAAGKVQSTDATKLSDALVHGLKELAPTHIPYIWI